MTMEMILAQLDRISADSEYEVYGNHIDLVIEDFEGFADDWSEVFRDYVNPDAVEAVLEWLEEHADRIDEDLYYLYYFGDITVQVGYGSFDI